MYRVIHLALFAFTTLAVGAEPKPNIISLNPAEPVPPAPTPPGPVVGPLKLTTGNVQVLAYTGGAVSRWLVVQPVGTGGVPWDVVGTEELPKGTSIYAKLEGSAKAGKHKFETDTLVLSSVSDAAGYVQVFALGPKNETLAHQIISVNHGARPPPDDGNKPDPVVPTDPTKLFVVIIEETSEAVAERGKLFTDQTLSARMKAKGHKFRVVDKDVKDADGKTPGDVKRFIDSASGKMLPQLFLVDDKGKVRMQTDLPTENLVGKLITYMQQVGG